MICDNCIHHSVCRKCSIGQYLTRNIDASCEDFHDKERTITTAFAVYERVFIVDRFDVENNCSQRGDGSGSKNIVLIPRECFVSDICIVDKGGEHLYRVQPVLPTSGESDDYYYYFEKSFFARELFKEKEDAEEHIASVGILTIQTPISNSANGG